MTALRETVEKAAADYLAKPANVGLAVGVLTGGERHTFGFGKLRRDADGPPDEHTLYEIASVTKVFTATLLAEMAARGEVRLDQPAAELLPADVPLPTYRGQPITLAHLAEHTSALPRLPDNLGATITDQANPYKDYEVRHLYEYLRTARIGFPPGSGVAYSNLGTGLLGHVLSLRGGKPYDELLTERVFRPLGMTDTAVSLTAEQTARLAPGHDESGKPTSQWDMPTVGGAGALRSSVAELLTFLRANLKPANGPLKAPIEACHAPRPMMWWRRVRIGRFHALGLAAVGLLAQRFVPVPPGGVVFLLTLLLPVFVALVWRGFWAGATAALLLWAGTLLLWGNSFGWVYAGVAYLLLFASVGVFTGYVPPQGTVRLGWQDTLIGLKPALWHNGGTGGYASFVGLVPEAGAAVAVLSNSANSVDDIGLALLKHLCSRKENP